MKKYVFIAIASLILSACKTGDNVVLYKDKEIMTVGVFTNSIRDFRWDLKSDSIFDSINILGKRSKELRSIIANLTKVSNIPPMGTPRYALVSEYNERKDTFYFYDFIDEDVYKNETYLVQNNLTLKDNNDELKKYFIKNYKKFIQKEVYHLPDDNKERYYYRELK